MKPLSLKSIFLALILPFSFYLLTLFGCATVPYTENLSSYSINGTTYFSLSTLCELRNIDMQFDTFARTAHLSKDSHTIDIRVGDALVLVDGSARMFDKPVDIYQGSVVVPYKFKEQILDVLFKEGGIAFKPSSCPLRIRKVVIDAGHGGYDPGAIGRTGLREKDVNLEIAKRLGNILRQEGVQVVMTRSSDRFIPLPKRVEITNNSGADLFIAIHSNANRVRSLNGLEVYYVSPSVNDSKRAYSAAREGRLDLGSECLANNSLDLKATLWDMIYTNSRAESIELSRSICRATSDKLGVRILGVKGARYEVLRGARMPAVLVEVGFLSNPNDERMLKNSYYREQIAEGIEAGIRDYSREAAIMQAQAR